MSNDWRPNYWIRYPWLRKVRSTMKAIKRSHLLCYCSQNSNMAARRCISQKGNIRVKFNLGSGFGSWRKQSGTCDDFSRISMWQARVQFASKFVCFFTACLWHFSPLTSLPALGQLWIIIDPHAKLTYSYAAKPAPTELRTSAATPKVSRAQKKMQYLKATKWSSCGTVIIRPHPDQNAPCIHKTENVWQYTCTPISCVLCGNVRKCAKSYMR